jgi:hypothetical protein
LLVCPIYLQVLWRQWRILEYMVLIYLMAL